MSTHHDAIAAYRARFTETIGLLARIMVAIEWHRKRFEEDGSVTRWGYVGDIGHVNEQLRNLLAFIGEPTK